jgi:diacylglycerol kinase family enzyme
MAGVPREETVRVYSVGGDGILFDCLNGVINFKNIELAIVPYGITNNFLCAFGYRKEEFFRDLELQTIGEGIPTDVIRYGSNYALNFCAVGLEAAAVVRTSRISRFLEDAMLPIRWFNFRYYASLYYLGGFLMAMQKNIIERHYEITIDNREYKGYFRSINIANGPCYGGDKRPNMAAVPNDGLLDVLMGKSAGFFRSVGLFAPYLKGQHAQFPADFIWQQGKVVTIRSDGPMYINCDDEPFFDTNITVELVPGAVKVVAVKGLRYQEQEEDRHENQL